MGSPTQAIRPSGCRDNGRPASRALVAIAWNLLCALGSLAPRGSLSACYWDGPIEAHAVVVNVWSGPWGQCCAGKTLPSGVTQAKAALAFGQVRAIAIAWNLCCAFALNLSSFKLIGCLELLCARIHGHACHE